MKTLWKRALSGALAVAVMATAAPGVLAYAAEAQTRENADNLELSDGYLSVSMSTENGGFLVKFGFAQKRRCGMMGAKPKRGDRDAADRHL